MRGLAWIIFWFWLLDDRHDEGFFFSLKQMCPNTSLQLELTLLLMSSPTKCSSQCQYGKIMQAHDQMHLPLTFIHKQVWRFEYLVTRGTIKPASWANVRRPCLDKPAASLQYALTSPGQQGIYHSGIQSSNRRAAIRALSKRQLTFCNA